PNIAPSADAQVERLLAQYIGPMARIFCARAHKASSTPDEFTKCLAEAIDDDSDRAAFIAAAAKLLRLKRH
ncbi:MAG: hypothetical protein ACXWIH_26570, partial [Burkholderiales bacterium]